MKFSETLHLVAQASLVSPRVILGALPSCTVTYMQESLAELPRILKFRKHDSQARRAFAHNDDSRLPDLARPLLPTSAPVATVAEMVYVRQEKLPGLKEYKYSGVDHSLLSRYVLKPFYTNVVIKCFPLWVAPNLITLSGFSFVVINVLTLLWYNPTLDQDCPSWVYYSWAIGLFLYQTFDAVDGSQARRTRQSGPLGELFDHGVDAVNTSLEVLIFAASQNLGMGWKTVMTLFGCM